MSTRRHLHLRNSEALDLLQGRLAAAARRRVVGYLGAGCADCAARLQKAAEERGCGSQVAWLLARWAAERQGCGAGVACGRSSYVEMLLELSFALRYSNAPAMLELALCAQRVANRRAPSQTSPEAVVFDLRARAAAEVANAERVNECFLLAEWNLDMGRELAAEGTGDLLVAARLDEVDARLQIDERHLEIADSLLDRAYDAYMTAGERHLAGRILVTRGRTHVLEGRPQEAVEAYRRALAHLDTGRDSQLVALTQHNLVEALVEAGLLKEAGELFFKANLREVFRAEPLFLLRLRWLEGKLAAGRGRHEAAQKAFGEVRDGFRTHGLEVAAAVVGTDLAKALLRQGKLGELHAVAAELHTRAREKEIHVPVREALCCFEVICRHGGVTELHVERLARFLRQADHHPAVRFEPELLLFG